MKKRQLALTFGSLITGIFILFSSCKKINEATELGGNLIPPIDNIHTFDTSITVEAYNDLFTLGGPDPLKEDSTRSIYTDEQILGLISSDPLFGKTDARMFFELTPPSYPFTFSNKPDSLHIDSVVLVLDHVETYGDSLVPQTVNVYEIDQSVDFRIDTSYLIRENNFTYFNLLGSKTFKPEVLNDSVKAFQDTTANQLRIRLDNSFGQRLLNYDTILTAGHLDGYSTDSVFKTRFKGFALQSFAGNAVMGFNLTGPNTKLAIYYRDDNGDSPKEDTTVAYFTFNIAFSASANYIKRDYSGSPLLAAQGGGSPDPFVYIQSTPGSFATIKIPDLAGLNNRVVHRAELIAEQVYDVSDSLFPPPAFLYLDAYSPTLSKYRNIPYDVIFDFASSQTYNLNSFGVVPINSLDGSGNVVRTWHFNLTRYVQHVVNDTEPPYDLRLFAPFRALDQYYQPVAGATPILPAPSVSLNPAIVKGRVRLAGNTDPLDPNPHRLRLRIIYSKL